MAKKTIYEFGELTKAQQDCLTLIESLGIYELRALARVFGDNSPTTLKRNDHISIVMNKIISGEDLKPIPLRQGRPYKELSNIAGILAELSQITGKDYTINSTLHRTTTPPQKLVMFNQEEQNIIEQKLFPIEVKGILRERPDGNLFFINKSNKKSILVKKNFDSRLKPFDFVSGTAIVMNEAQEYILDTIKTINYVSAEKYEDVENPYGDEIVPTKHFKLGSKEIVLGKTYVVKKDRLRDYVPQLQAIVANLKANKIIPIALIPNVRQADYSLINSLGFCYTFMLGYDDRPYDIYEQVSAMLSHITKLQNQGYNLALFAEDMPTVLNALDFSFKSNTKAYVGHSEQTVDLLKQVVMFAKAGSNDRTTTLFASFDDADFLDQSFVSYVYKVSQKIDI